MGERTNGVKGDDPQKRTRELAHQIEATRGELGGLVGELDRRRHDALDWRLQFSRHAVSAAIVGGALLALAGGLVALGFWRHGQRQRLIPQVRRLREAVRHMMDQPREVARAENTLHRVLTTAATAATGMLVKRMIARTVGDAKQAHRHAAA